MNDYSSLYDDGSLYYLVVAAYGVYKPEDVDSKLTELLGPDKELWTAEDFLSEYYSLDYVDEYRENVAILSKIDYVIDSFGFNKSSWLEPVDRDYIYLNYYPNKIKSVTNVYEIEKAILDYLFYKTDNLNKICTRIAEKYPNEDVMDVVIQLTEGYYGDKLLRVYYAGLKL